MNKLYFLLLVFISGCSSWSHAQGFFEEENWNRYRHHVEFGIGTTNFLGDLGGKDAIGTNDLQDLEWSQFHLALMGGYRYHLLKPLLIRVDGAYGRLTGDDKLTQEPFRMNRNLNFKSTVWEVNLMGEFRIMLGDGKKGHEYNIERVNSESAPWRYRGSYISISAGVGMFHFNPKTEIEGQTVELKPLRTEGQGLPGGAKEYSLFQFNIPIGFSWMVKMHKQWSFGIDITHRYTFTDYMDDVSTVYYNPSDLALYSEENVADLAAYLSNPALGVANGGLSDRVTAPGQQRGDKKDMDGYFYAMVKVDYLIMKKNGFYTKKTKSKGQFRQFKRIKPMTF